MSNETKAPSEPAGGQALEVVPPAPVPKQRGGWLTTILFTLVAGLIGVVLGAAGVGHNILQQFTPDARQARELRQFAERMEELRKDLAGREKELAAERQERKEAVGVLRASLEGAERAAASAAAGAAFMGRLLAYEQNKTDAARAELIDALCSLRTRATDARIALLRSPLEVSQSEIREGVRPELEQVLLQGGVSAELMARIRRNATQVPLPQVTAYNVSEVQRAAQLRRAAARDAHEALAAVQRGAQTIEIVRAVKFADGTEYAVPRDVALFARARKDCSPG